MGYVMKIRGLISDIAIIAGIACVVYGVSMFSGPAAWIVGGILTILAGAAAGMEGKDK